MIWHNCEKTNDDRLKKALENSRQNWKYSNDCNQTSISSENISIEKHVKKLKFEYAYKSKSVLDNQTQKNNLGYWDFGCDA